MAVADEAYEYAQQNSAPGSGGRFKALKNKLATQKGVKNPAGLAAFIGRKKFGKAGFQAMAQGGKC